MDYNLLVCIKVRREKFQIKNYIGDDNILALLESGSFSFDDGTGIQTVSPLEAVNFKKGKPYQRHITDTATMYLFRYKSSSDLFNQSKITFKNKARIKSTLEFLNISDNSLYHNDFQYKKSLFADLVTQYKLENINASESPVVKDETIHAVIEDINAKLHRKINLAQIASNHFLSYAQFSRRFKLAAGISPQDYIADMRIKKAKQMLGESELLIKDIATECGFANEYYFSNFFKKYSDFSPSEFRKIISSTNNS